MALVSSISAFAQSSFEEFQKQHQQRFQQFKDDQQRKFDEFRKEKNQKYAEFLKEKWEIFDAQPKEEPISEAPVPPVVYEEPTPTPTPTPQPQPTPILVEDEPIVIPEPEPQPEPIVPIVPQEDLNYRPIKIAFFGSSVEIRFPKSDNFKINNISDNDLAQAWELLMNEQYDVVISDALKVRSELNLCDWAYIEMLQLITEKAYGKGTNEASFMQAYILVQSGYKIRLAHSEQKMYMLVASQHSILDMSYFVIDNEKFYPLNCKEDELYISEATFDSEKPLSLHITSEQKLQYESTPIRTLTSKNKVSAQVCTNMNLIDFYNTYPSSYINEDFGTRWAAYANTPFDVRIQQKLYPQLKASINGKSQWEAVNILLNWVQTAFTYEYDDKVWGEDRAFFPEETLYYPYCDCEDRSILFSRIVRDLLNLDVVLLYYPGHLATAVHFTDDANGDYLYVNNQRYIVCDPTYIGAPVGATMPGMDNQTAKVIILSKSNKH